MKKVLISVGPIPGKLDSVKYITNRFKGGLALKTAKALASEFEVTIVAWTHTDLNDFQKSERVIRVDDVFAYFEYIENCAIQKRFDAYIMAAAVANLVPKDPWEGKFPSHDYEVGDEINIPFTIAPRAIDVVKKYHPRSTLIGYKLFDGDREELVRAAKHTLKDSKANVIFANTPKDAKVKKIALTQSNAEIDMDFNEHIEFIKKAINAQYYSTKVIPPEEDTAFEERVSPMSLSNPFWAKMAIDVFQRTYDHGSLAVRIRNCYHMDNSVRMLISGRGHKGVPAVIQVLKKDKKIIATGKASANAPMIYEFMMGEIYDVVLHEHRILNKVRTFPYCLPGTQEEVKIVSSLNGQSAFNIEHHGYVRGYKRAPMNWDEYYDIYPHRFFKTPDFIYRALAEERGANILDIGCNKRPVARATHVIEPNTIVPEHGVYGDKNGTNITWGDLARGELKFDLIVLSNSINYLSLGEIKEAIKSLKPGGRIIANSFGKLTDSKITDDGIAVLHDDLILHVLFLDNGLCMEHVFCNSPIDLWQELGFNIVPYGNNSLMLEFVKNEC